MSTVQQNVSEKNRRVLDALNAGVREALIKHKQAGVPIAVWEDGKVVEIPADEIVIPPDPFAKL